MRVLFYFITCMVLALVCTENCFGYEIYGSEESNEFQTYIQPDYYGTEFEAKMWGDGIIWEQETDDGYTIISRGDGYWCYAILDTAGYYVPSPYRVGIDQPPTWMSTHMRRSSSANNNLENMYVEFDDAVTEAAERFELRRDQMQDTTIGIIFFDFPDYQHSADSLPHYDAENINLMFVSGDTTFFGDRYGKIKETPNGEEPFGSVRDYFQQISNDSLRISAGGPFGWADDTTDALNRNLRDLIINPLDANGEIQWLRMDSLVRHTANGLVNNFPSPTSVIAKALQKHWINDAQNPNLEMVLFVAAGMCTEMKMEEKADTVRIGNNTIPCTIDFERQGFQGFAIVNQALKLKNIGLFCHEIGHVIGFGHPGTGGYSDVMYMGCWNSPYGNQGEECLRGTCPVRTNPFFLESIHWANVIAITHDTDSLMVLYSAKRPSFYSFIYQAKNDAAASGWGRFILENRQMATLANQDTALDFESFGPGSYEWGRRGGQYNHASGHRNNLLMWHLEGRNERGGSIGISLERANGDSTDRTDGTDLFPGTHNVTSFGPGGPINGNSRDKVSLNARRVYPFQTGFCIKNIKDTLNYIRCDVYTNYWGGDITENLNLETLNEDDRDLRFGGDTCKIKSGHTVTVTPSDPDNECAIYLDSDIIIENTAKLIIKCPKWRSSQGGNPAVTAQLFIYGWRTITIEHGGTLEFVPFETGVDQRHLTAQMHIITDEDWRFPSPGAIAFEGNGSGTAIFGTDCDIDLTNASFSDYESALSLDGCTGTITNCTFTDISGTAIDLLDCTDSQSNRVTLDNCTSTNCGVGVYANNSRLTLDSCTISGSHDATLYGRGVQLENCAAGKVIITGCSIVNNGTDTTYNSAGVYCHSSSPQIVSTTIEDNSGSGIVCLASTPDLDTYDTSEHHNNIHSNGGANQSNSSGAEIYLASSSYPSIHYNNIWDYGTGPIGKMIYKHATSNNGSLNSNYNWWGNASPTNSYFYWGGGSAIVYSPAASSAYTTVGVDDYETAMGLWDTGDFAGAAELFQRCVGDTGVIGMNSVHYLAGCYGQIEPHNYDGLRGVLQTAAANQTDSRVAKIALRFATDCLTQQELYDEAMQEYDATRQGAECFEDSVLAVVDYLAVYELAHGGGVDAVGESIHGKMSKLLAGLDGERDGSSPTLPSEVALIGCYPNPFNGTTTVAFDLPTAGNVKLAVFDMTGREVAVLLDGQETAGAHRTMWQSGGAPTGVYLLRLESAGQVRTQKLMLVR